MALEIEEKILEDLQMLQTTVLCKHLSRIAIMSKTTQFLKIYLYEREHKQWERQRETEKQATH